MDHQTLLPEDLLQALVQRAGHLPVLSEYQHPLPLLLDGLADLLHDLHLPAALVGEVPGSIVLIGMVADLLELRQR